MDYGPDRSIKLRFFEQGIEKFIKDKSTLRPEVLDWLVDQAWYSWVLGITSEEFKLVPVFEKICADLFSIDPSTAESVFRSMYNMLPEAEDRVASIREMTERELGKKDDSSQSQKVREVLSLYNCLYENNFKVWGTPLYASSIYAFKNKHQVKDPANVVHVPTSTKIQSIKEIKFKEPYGDMSVFLKGFDNEIRNAGVGHESFEIHDDGSFSLRVTDPFSGEIKGSGVITLTLKDLNGLIKEMEKTLWFFKVGLNVFFANNRSTVERIAILEEMKIRDIRKDFESFCDNRWLKIEQFDFNEKDHALSLALKYSPQILGEKSEVFIGTAEAWDLIKRKMVVKYKEQIIGCIFHLLRLFNTRKTGVPKIFLIVKDENRKELMSLDFTKEELARFLVEYKIPPQPIKGEYYDGNYVMEYHVRVPYGMRDVMEPMIDEWEAENKDK